MLPLTQILIHSSFISFLFFSSLLYLFFFIIFSFYHKIKIKGSKIGLWHSFTLLAILLDASKIIGCQLTSFMVHMNSKRHDPLLFFFFHFCSYFFNCFLIFAWFWIFLHKLFWSAFYEVIVVSNKYPGIWCMLNYMSVYFFYYVIM
jgi:hypothetical protein